MEHDTALHALSHETRALVHPTRPRHLTATRVPSRRRARLAARLRHAADRLDPA